MSIYMYNIHMMIYTYIYVCFFPLSSTHSVPPWIHFPMASHGVPPPGEATRELRLSRDVSSQAATREWPLS